MKNFFFTSEEVTDITSRIVHASLNDQGQPISGKETMILQIMLLSYGQLIVAFRKLNPGAFAAICARDSSTDFIASALIDEIQKERERYLKENGHD